MVVGTDATLTVTPTGPTTYEVTVTCSSRPDCAATASIAVDVHLPPKLDAPTGRDPDPCHLGLEIAWPIATFFDPTGSGVFNIYRSETSCADAAASAPIATGLTDLTWTDHSTDAGNSYWYVVQAEDARTSTPCSTGPHHGGAVNASLACVGPVLESPEAATPELLGWALRVRHVADTLTLSWSGARALLPDEHFHVLEGGHGVPFVMANAEGDVVTERTETDISRPLRWFDVRIANRCEIESLDDEPPGWD